MSSKSRKHSSVPARTPQQGAKPDADGGKTRANVTDAQHAEPTAKDFLEAEDILKVPRGRSPVTYAFLIFLLIVLAATFMVSDYLSMMGRGGRRAAEQSISWRMPDGARRQLDGVRWNRERVLFGLTIETLQGSRARIPDSEIARLVVVDALAEAAGVRVSEAELVQELTPIVRAFGGDPSYRARFGPRRGLTVAQFEATYHRLLRIQRFERYLAVLAAQPGAAAIERLWADQRKETAYDWAMAPVSAYVEAARAEQPDDATLAAWFEARPDHLRARYEVPARTRAELVGVLLEDGAQQDLSALLAAYPRPEGVDAETRAREFYQEWGFARFRRPAGEEGPMYLDFEDVAERAAFEAAAYDALVAWRADLDARAQAGEEIDLAAEAARLGLVYVAPEVPRTQVQWREAGGLSGVYVAAELVRGTPGRLTAGIVVGERGLVVARVTEQLPPAVPALDEIRDAVHEEWVMARARELATAAMAEFRAGLLGGGADAAGDDAPRVDEATFLEAARAAGFEVGHRGWLDSTAARDADPDAAHPAHEVLRARAFSLTLAEGELSEPLVSSDEAHVVLARSLGSRQIPIERMTASDFQSFVDQARQNNEFGWAFGETPFTYDALVRDFDLRIPVTETRPVDDEGDEL